MADRTFVDMSSVFYRLAFFHYSIEQHTLLNLVLWNFKVRNNLINEKKLLILKSNSRKYDMYIEKIHWRISWIAIGTVIIVEKNDTHPNYSLAMSLRNFNCQHSSLLKKPLVFLLNEILFFCLFREIQSITFGKVSSKNIANKNLYKNIIYACSFNKTSTKNKYLFDYWY